MNRTRSVALPRTAALLIGGLLLLAVALVAPLSVAGTAAASDVPAAQAPAAAVAQSDEESPGGGVTVQSTPGTDAEEAADSGSDEGTPVWIFYALVVVVAVGGLVFARMRRRPRH